MSLGVTGAPDAVLWNDASTTSKLASLVGPVASALSGSGHPAKLPGSSQDLTAKDLALVAFDLQRFQHKVLGPGAPRPAASDENGNALPHPPKIPATLFLPAASLSSMSLPPAEDSPLSCILQAALISAASRSLESWNVDDAANEGKLRQVVVEVRAALRAKGHLPKHTVFGETEISEAEIVAYRKLATQLDCEWTSDRSAATHILFSSPESTPSSPSASTAAPSEYFRTLARTTLASGKAVALIHVWYRPDSFDTWLPAKDFSSPEPEPAPKNPELARTVGTKWLVESAKYNELMNEEDYEKDDAEEAKAGAEEVGLGDAEAGISDAKSEKPRKRSLPDEVTEEAEGEGSAAPGSKRIRLFVASRPSGAIAVDVSGASGPAPGKNYESNPVPGGAIGNLPPEAAPGRSQGASPAVHVAGDTSIADGDVTMGEAALPLVEVEEVPSAADAAAAASADAADRQAQQAEADNLARMYLAEQTQEVIIPSYSTWFSFGSIHSIEKRSLPEFFNGRNRSKTPSIYKDYRDFMVNTYRLNPSEYLTFTACRRNLAGDVCAIMRVHALLEQWGLINYQVDPDTRPATLGPPFTGHFRITVDTPRGLQHAHPGTKPRPARTLLADGESGAQHPQASSSAQPGAPDLTLELRRNVYQTTMKAAVTVDGQTATSLAAAADAALKAGAGAASSYSCDTCGTECTRSRYHSVHAPSRGPGAGGYVLCPNCYLEGRFPSSMYSGDFVRIDDSPFKQGGAPSQDDWSDAEVLRLLEGLEMYDDDWAQVASHVGTRSREQCITRFLQMPIEDPYLDGGAPRKPTSGIDATQKASRETTQSDLGALQYVRDLKNAAIPFAQTDNPVMSVVAFLASAVSPAVAAAAAQSALGELTDGMRKRIASKDGSQNSQAAAGAMGADGAPKAQDERSKEDSGAPGAAGASADNAMDVDSSDKTADVSIKVTDAAKSAVAQAREDREDLAKDSQAIPRNAVEKAAAIALGAAAAKASILASHEERECQRLVGQIIEAQMRKMEIKMSHFEELEGLLEQERRSVEAGRKQLYADRLALSKQVAAVNDLLKRAREAPANVTPADVAAASSLAHGLPQQGPSVQANEVPAHPSSGNYAQL
ncbi:Chromatin remodeling factor subunit and related transcription factors [Ceraceosorus bombacis]|uniref:Chromatin remodeling factor subunit and related transcription factors n=1 Tax=Ceraceosorus bombacis TaxID=401625 RepID=A0A0P1BE51_9BASI|nr:Chromatin remodeling factor subunit and related transcription factors [Ceraceosorus bombacis]